MLSRFCVSQFSYCMYCISIPVETNKKMVQKIWEVSVCDHKTFNKLKIINCVLFWCHHSVVCICVYLCLCNISIEMAVLNSCLHTAIAQPHSSKAPPLHLLLFVSSSFPLLYWLVKSHYLNEVFSFHKTYREHISTHHFDFMLPKIKFQILHSVL